ncbi:MAG: GNAT family N-acetyltransferase [Gemmataceae bacterium]|nr:GNAT family N-acetyltransferase [Gemmataceae bacterium]
MRNPYLIGQTVYLRPVERDDADLVAPWVNDPEVRWYLAGRPPINQVSELDYIDRMSRSEHDLVLLIVRVEDDRRIGMQGLHQIDFRNRHACFGIALGDKEAWGQGYGTEATRLLLQHAFETMNLNRVWLQVYEYNERAMRSYLKLGFKKEGVLRQENFRKGKYWDRFGRQTQTKIKTEITIRN